MNLKLFFLIPFIALAPLQAKTFPSAVELEKSWPRQVIERYPETLWLADADVRSTEEGIAIGASHSEKLFGKKYIEFDRTLMSLQCLHLILKGDDLAYQQFTAAQPAEVRLSRESFEMLHKQAEALFQSPSFSKQEMIEAMETALVLGDIGKSQKGRDHFKSHGIKAPDHDDFHAEVMQVLKKHPELCPSFERLPAKAQTLLIDSVNLAHYGHIVHLEGGLEMLRPLKESKVGLENPFALEFDLILYFCDASGALGHVENRSSLVYTQPTHQAMQAMASAIHLFSNPETTEADVYNAYLAKRAEWLGLDANNGNDRVLARIGAMLRLFTHEDGRKLREAMEQLSVFERERIVAQLDIQKPSAIVRTPTYIPAFLVNLVAKVGLEKAVTLGLPFVAKVLEHHQEELVEGKKCKEIPLNFNAVAGLVKKHPEIVNQSFSIDEENNVRL